MSLRLNSTIDAFIDKMIRNEKFMAIMNLPTILDTDDEDIKKKKKTLIIDKVITKTAQNPFELNKDFPEIKIGNEKYKGFGKKVRMTVSLAQSIKMNSYVFGNPQIDIYIYYDNTENIDVFKLLDLISDEFSGQQLEVQTDEGKQMIKEIKCEGLTSQTAIINNFERIGIRFSFYANIYKI